MTDDIIDILISQDYSRILSYQSIKVTLEVEVDKKYIKKYLLAEDEAPPKYDDFSPITGFISKNSAGRYVGILKKSEGLPNLRYVPSKLTSVKRVLGN